MKLVAYKKGSITQPELNKAVRGELFTFLGSPSDFIFDPSTPTDIAKGYPEGLTESISAIFDKFQAKS